MFRLDVLRLVALTIVMCASVSLAAEKEKATILKDKLGSTPNVTRFGKTLFGGQPSPEALEEAQKRGIASVITFRTKGEVDWDEAGKAKDLNMSFHRFGFRSPESMTDTLIDQARKVLVDSKDQPKMLYCGSANRVGAIWMAHRALDGGLSVEEALKEGEKIGLRNKGYVAVVKDYIRRNKKNP